MNGAELPWWSLVPFALSTLAFGLPHGAVDHLVAARLLGWRQPGALGWVTIVGGYLALTAAGLLLWVVTPQMGFAAFIALTWYHWGQGELEAATRWRSGWLGGRAHRAVYLAWRGSQPMMLPLVLHADVYALVAKGCLGLFGAFDAGFLEGIRGSGPVAGAVCGVLWLLEKVLAPQGTRWAGDKLMLDVGVTVILLFLHPVFGVGLYFLCWHAPHHMNRLRHFLGDETGCWSWRRLLIAALPLTIATIAGLGLLGGVGAWRSLNALNFLALYLVGLACLTWPHALLVSAQDAREHIWQSEKRI